MVLYVQYGCGWAEQPKTWQNFDASPTLRNERIPVIGRLYTKNPTRFPFNVEYGDIVTGLPINSNSCDGLYACHVLEHLALDDFRIALRHSLDYLKPGGPFRLIVPDLRALTIAYLNSHDPLAAHQFMRDSYLGLEARPRGLLSSVKSWLGNSSHLWMWDYNSLQNELRVAGFVDIRPCAFGDASDPLFNEVEESSRFVDAVAIEARKPG